MEVVCFGEILWDRLPSGDQPGGAPMNVAYHLNRLGLPAALISRVGQDDLGNRLLQLLTDRAVTTRWVQKDPEQPTGLVLATVQPNNEVQYEIRQPVAWDFIEPDPGFEKLLQGARFFVFGSLAARNDRSRKTLFQLLEHPVQKVLDINLRAPHFSQPVIEALMQKAQVLKLNEHELPLISGWYGNATSQEDQVQLLQDRFRIPSILVTCGADGALLNLEGIVYRHSGFTVQVQDTVGSGDAFLAGYLSQTVTNQAPEKRLRFANQMRAFVATRKGACPLYSLDDIASINEPAF